MNLYRHKLTGFVRTNEWIIKVYELFNSYDSLKVILKYWSVNLGLILCKNEKIEQYIKNKIIS